MDQTDRTIALVTGGSRGLGRGMAEHLARAGADVIVTWRARQDEAEAVVRGIEASGRRAAALQLDAGDVASFDAFAERLASTLDRVWTRKSFDVLINNAGTSLHNSIAETTEHEFDEVMRVHLKGPYFLTQRLLPMLADGARILNISSGLARASLPGSSAYAMMKGGVEVFTRYLAVELAARGITANTLAPGAIETDFSGGMVRDNPQVNRMVSEMTALGRPGRVSDIGPIAASLVSADNRWMTGQRIEASGGMRL
ncbi:SDR family NAD(P)-dependent oxidoreductase [Lichenicoccus sp.]|uniref:SDR family NAD(P)-dependent oxidoreductase n=1 Tax=Lichenicoccus sp. TaxID=2781899 RepID=UPI003D095BB1